MGMNLVLGLICSVLLMSQLPENGEPMQPNGSNTGRE